MTQLRHRTSETVCRAPSPTICLLIALVCPHTLRAIGAEADSAHEILQKIAARYASATDYSLRVRTNSSSSSSTFTLAAALPHHFMLRQKSRTNGRFELLLIADATTAWGYQPHRKLYTKSGPERGEERTELARVHHQYFGRFQHLDRLATNAKVVGHGSVRSGGRAVLCIRVRIESTGESGTEELWIDPTRHLVLKAVARHKRPMPDTGDIVTTTVWQECDLDHPADPSLFTFQPPPGAHRTNTLEYR